MTPAALSVTPSPGGATRPLPLVTAAERTKQGDGGGGAAADGRAPHGPPEPGLSSLGPGHADALAYRLACARLRTLYQAAFGGFATQQMLLTLPAR